MEPKMRFDSTSVVDAIPRSSRPEVRNPLFSLPAAKRLLALDPEQRRVLRQVLMDLRSQAHARAEASWKARKGPMAVYFRCIAVYAGHIARMLRDQAPRREHVTERKSFQ